MSYLQEYRFQIRAIGEEIVENIQEGNLDESDTVNIIMELENLIDEIDSTSSEIFEEEEEDEENSNFWCKC